MYCLKNLVMFENQLFRVFNVTNSEYCLILFEALLRSRFSFCVFRGQRVALIDDDISHIIKIIHYSKFVTSSSQKILIIKHKWDFLSAYWRNSCETEFLVPRHSARIIKIITLGEFHYTRCVAVRHPAFELKLYTQTSMFYKARQVGFSTIRTLM